MIPYMVGKITPNSTYFTRLVKFVPGSPVGAIYVPSPLKTGVFCDIPPPFIEQLCWKTKENHRRRRATSVPSARCCACLYIRYNRAIWPCHPPSHSILPAPFVCVCVCMFSISSCRPRPLIIVWIEDFTQFNASKCMSRYFCVISMPPLLTSLCPNYDSLVYRLIAYSSSSFFRLA